MAPPGRGAPAELTPAQERARAAADAPERCLRRCRAALCAECTPAAARLLLAARAQELLLRRLAELRESGDESKTTRQEKAQLKRQLRQV